MVMPRKLNNEQLKKLKKLWKEGYSRAELAARFNCSVSCVGYMVRDGEKRLANLVSFNNRKVGYLVGEEYDITRMYYHLDKAKEYVESLTKKLNRRFPDYAEYFNNKSRLCSEKIENIKLPIQNYLKTDWDFIEEDCKKRWREFEKEHRAKNGRSSKNFLDRF